MRFRPTTLKVLDNEFYICTYCLSCFLVGMANGEFGIADFGIAVKTEKDIFGKYRYRN